jgi:tetratricopeptide (TPR) repeat protein
MNPRQWRDAAHGVSQGISRGTFSRLSHRPSCRVGTLLYACVVSAALLLPFPALGKAPELTAEQWFAEANAHWDEKSGTFDDLRAAIRALNEAIRLAPSEDAYRNRGLAYQGLKLYRKAIEDFGHAIALDPLSAPAYFLRALAYTSLNDKVRARADAREACDLKDTYACDWLLKKL